MASASATTWLSEPEVSTRKSVVVVGPAGGVARPDAVAVGVVGVLDDRAVGLLDADQAVLVVPGVGGFGVLRRQVAVVVPAVGRGGDGVELFAARRSRVS